MGFIIFNQSLMKLAKGCSTEKESFNPCRINQNFGGVNKLLRGVNKLILIEQYKCNFCLYVYFSKNFNSFILLLYGKDLSINQPMRFELMALLFMQEQYLKF